MPDNDLAPRSSRGGSSEVAMLVCHCTGVTDRTIRKLVREGHMTMDEIARACGAGSCCGGCGPAVEGVIHSEAAHRGSVIATISTRQSANAS